MQKSQQRVFSYFDTVRLFIFVLIVWTLQPHFTLWLSVAVFYLLRVCACHNTSVLYLALTSVGLIVLLWM